MTHLLRDLIAAGGLRIGRRYRDKHGGYDTATRLASSFLGMRRHQVRTPTSLGNRAPRLPQADRRSPQLSSRDFSYSGTVCDGVPEARTSAAANDAVDPL